MVGGEFLLVVVNPVSPIISQLQSPSRHSDISWSHHGGRAYGENGGQDRVLDSSKLIYLGRELPGVEVGDLV